MTTVIAVQTADDVILGWDSMMTRSNEVGTLVTPKVWCNNGIIFGISGTMRALDLMSVLDFPEYDGSDARSWIITNVVPLIHAVLRANEQAPLWDTEDGTAPMGMIMVVDGTAFVFDGLLSPACTVEGVYTMGSGGDYARGALVAQDVKYSPFTNPEVRYQIDDQDVMLALRVASEIDPYTGGHLTVTTANKMIMAEEN